MSLREELFELLRTDRGFREEVRRQVLTEELLALPALVQELVEAQRRAGERYERQIVRRAPMLFNGGQGGSPEELWVQQRLSEALGAVLSQDVLAAERAGSSVRRLINTSAKAACNAV
jgi:hypothetical protein